MACGDKYAHLVRTADGYTAKRRHGGIIATELHYASWHEAATAMPAKVNKQWSILRKAELEREQGTPLSDGLTHGISAYIAATKELPEPWSIWDDPQTKADPAPRIDQAVDVMAMGACELEKIDQAIGSLGIVVPDVPGPKPTGNGTQSGLGGIFESIKTVAILGVIGVAAYGIAKLVILSRKQPALPAVEVE